MKRAGRALQVYEMRDRVDSLCNQWVSCYNFAECLGGGGGTYVVVDSPAVSLHLSASFRLKQ